MSLWPNLCAHPMSPPVSSMSPPVFPFFPKVHFCLTPMSPLPSHVPFYVPKCYIPIFFLCPLLCSPISTMSFPVSIPMFLYASMSSPLSPLTFLICSLYPFLCVSYISPSISPPMSLYVPILCPPLFNSYVVPKSPCSS